MSDTVTNDQLKAMTYDRMQELMGLYRYTDNRLMMGQVSQSQLREGLDSELSAFIGRVVLDLKRIVESK